MDDCRIGYFVRKKYATKKEAYRRNGPYLPINHSGWVTATFDFHLKLMAALTFQSVIHGGQGLSSATFDFHLKLI